MAYSIQTRTSLEERRTVRMVHRDKMETMLKILRLSIRLGAMQKPVTQGATASVGKMEGVEAMPPTGVTVLPPPRLL